MGGEPGVPVPVWKKLVANPIPDIPGVEESARILGPIGLIRPSSRLADQFARQDVVLQPLDGIADPGGHRCRSVEQCARSKGQGRAIERGQPPESGRHPFGDRRPLARTEPLGRRQSSGTNGPQLATLTNDRTDRPASPMPSDRRTARRSPRPPARSGAPAPARHRCSRCRADAPRSPSCDRVGRHRGCRWWSRHERGSSSARTASVR